MVAHQGSHNFSHIINAQITLLMHQIADYNYPVITQQINLLLCIHNVNLNEYFQILNFMQVG